MRMLENKLVGNRGLVMINELGFYQREKSLLGGHKDVRPACHAASAHALGGGDVR